MIKRTKGTRAVARGVASHLFLLSQSWRSLEGAREVRGWGGWVVLSTYSHVNADL